MSQSSMESVISVALKLLIAIIVFLIFVVIIYNLLDAQTQMSAREIFALILGISTLGLLGLAVYTFILQE